MVAAAVERYRDLYNSVRPHEAIGFSIPLSAWHDQDGIPIVNPFTPETVSLS